jgi:Predicted membrane protein (DUF2207)
VPADQLLAADDGMSIPLVVAAAVVAVTWLVVLVAVRIARRPRHIHAGPMTMEMPPETPAVAGLLCDNFVPTAELPPATLLDLADRRVVRLEEVAPGKTVCRLRRLYHDETLTAYERRVLDEAERKAIDGVVPADALTTGIEETSKRWQRSFQQEVVAEAQATGLTRNRWPYGVVSILFAGPTLAGLLWLVAFFVGGDDEGQAVLGWTATAVAGLTGLVGFGIVWRWARSLDQLPTKQGRAAAARALGYRAQLRENEQLAELSPAAVQLWGRHFAYAAAMGVARTAVELLPFGAEDDNRAWSRFGGRWRRVYVRYPRGWPPGWGKHPAFAIFLAVLWGAVSIAALYGLTRLAQSAAETSTSSDPTFTREQLDWIGRGALLLTIPFALVLLWALYVLVRAVPDLWLRRTANGGLVRARARSQIFQSNNDNPEQWYYLALDDGTRSRIRSWRVRHELYDAHTQGETVEAVYTPNLGYVREMRAAAAT